MKSFTVPTSQDGKPLPRQHWDAEQLRNHLTNLEQIHEVMVSMQSQHLDELSMLNRMASSLCHRWSYDEVVNDALKEITELTECRGVWLVDCSSTEPMTAVHVRDDPVIGLSSLPQAVRALCHRCHEAASGDMMQLTDGDNVYLAIPVLSGHHLIGCLVILCGERSIRDDAHLKRLLLSIVRQAAVACKNDRLVDAVGEMMVEVTYAFASAVESRDPYTGGHVQRVTAYAMLLAGLLGRPPHDMARIQIGGLLHDIGKIAVPDAILGKADALTDEEFEVIKTHPAVGHNIIRMIPQLSSALDIVRHHHERWDGRGYPDGLEATGIDPLARIMAVADTYDAMTSDRPYRKGLSHELTMAEIDRNAGSQFDPEITKMFIRISREQLMAAASDLEVACATRSHSNTMNLSELLDLDMREIQPHTAGRGAVWPNLEQLCLRQPQGKPLPSAAPDADTNTGSNKDAANAPPSKNDTPETPPRKPAGGLGGSPPDPPVHAASEDQSTAQHNDFTLLGVPASTAAQRDADEPAEAA